MKNNLYTMWTQTFVRDDIYLIKYARVNHLTLLYINLSKNTLFSEKENSFLLTYFLDCD